MKRLLALAIFFLALGATGRADAWPGGRKRGAQPPPPRPDSAAAAAAPRPDDVDKKPDEHRPDEASRPDEPAKADEKSAYHPRADDDEEPPPHHGPVTMKVGIELQSLGKLDLAQGTYEAEFFTVVHCDREPCDPRFEAENGKITGRELVHSEKLFKIFKFKASLRADIDFSDYPYDDHHLGVVLEDRRDPEETSLEFDKEHTHFEKDIKLAGFTLVSDAARVETEDPGDGQHISTLHYEVRVERPRAAATIKTVIPLLFLVAVAGLTLLLRPKSASGRLSAGTAGLVATAAFHAAQASALPQVSYLTRLDKFMAVTYFLYLVGIGFSIAMVRFEEAQDEARANMAYRLAAGVVPGLALIGWVLVLTRLF